MRPVSPNSVALRLRTSALNVLRSGPHTVLWTEPRLGLGNLLYLWLQSHLRTEKGRPATALWRPEMAPWITAFPMVDSLTTKEEDVGLRSRRELGFFQGWGVHYLPEHIERFTAELVATAAEPIIGSPETLTVNVRRGDFFHQKFGSRFAFNQQAYLQVAVDRAARTGGPIEDLLVVSDDISWCRANLAWLGNHARTIRFSAEKSTALQDFTAVAQSRRLVLTNSTFGYWAAHVSNHLHRTNHADVVVPWFHDRSVWSGAAYQLNPAWTVIRDIPGGWGEQPS